MTEARPQARPGPTDRAGEEARRSRIRHAAARPMAVNLAETFEHSHKLLSFAGAAAGARPASTAR